MATFCVIILCISIFIVGTAELNYTKAKKVRSRDCHFTYQLLLIAIFLNKYFIGPNKNDRMYIPCLSWIVPSNCLFAFLDLYVLRTK